VREGGNAVYIIGWAEQILGVVRHLGEQGYDGRVVTTSAFYTSREIKEAGEFANGILFALPPFDRTAEREPVEGFVNRYMDTYPRAPDVFAAYGYDAMRVAIEVMRIASSTETSEIIGALLDFDVNRYAGVTGEIEFDEYGEVTHDPEMFIVKDGQILSHQRYRKRVQREVQDLLHDRD
jgi:branched-chain amino acid transport system substrate-binding protein